MTQQQKPNQAVNQSLSIGLLLGAWKAGQNRYQQTGDAGEALHVGTNMALRLFAWIVVCFQWWMALGWVAIWWFALLSGNYTPTSKLLPMVLAVPFLIVLSPLLGVLWCRNGDYGLFQRGPVYRFWQPIARRVEAWSEANVYLILIGGIAASDILLTILP